MQHRAPSIFGTHTSFSPWIIVKANNKRKARLESIRYVLSILEYPGKQDARVSLITDPNVVMRFHRAALKVDGSARALVLHATFVPCRIVFEHCTDAMPRGKPERQVLDVASGEPWPGACCISLRTPAPAPPPPP